MAVVQFWVSRKELRGQFQIFRRGQNNNMAANKSPHYDMKKVPLDQNPFVDSQTGKVILPSLLSLEQEQKFEIKPTQFIGNYSLSASIAHVRHYSIPDEFREAYMRLTEVDLYYLKFIARFKSVQKIHLLRQASLFPEIFDDSRLSESLHRLLVNGLVWRWKYKHPVYGKKIDVYTLSGYGFEFLTFIYGYQGYFNPRHYYSWRFPNVYQLRFWETVDIYQTLVSLDAYKDSSELYRGNNKIMFSPLQVALELGKYNVKNFIYYPTLQVDGDKYYEAALEKWDVFTKHGTDITQQVNNLPGKQNILTFYTATYKLACQFATSLQLAQYRFPIIFMIGSLISSQGVSHSFYAPLTDKEEGTEPIQEVNFDNILQTGSGSNDK